MFHNITERIVNSLFIIGQVLITILCIIMPVVIFNTVSIYINDYDTIRMVQATFLMVSIIISIGLLMWYTKYVTYSFRYYILDKYFYDDTILE